ncbi:DUF808 domain-containing protein [Vibrio sp.]|nr:DUF808 domain-containing protein [Vibrio sp.]
MAGLLFALLDDVAAVLDDVAIVSKTAAKKTAGVLGDDLALNAQQMTGIKAERELPVVWAVAKGSLRNKAILVPGALLLSWFAPALIIPMLLMGGLFLCFEGVEKIIEVTQKLGKPKPDATESVERLEEMHSEEYEKKRINIAIRTDFILSAEIIVITLGTVQNQPMPVQIGVVCFMALAITVFVYGLVAGIVKMDDAGLYLQRNSTPRSFKYYVGRALLISAPKFLKVLTVVGTAAMFFVGGGIITHNIEPIHHAVYPALDHLPANPVLDAIAPMLLDGVVGLVAGMILVAVYTVGKKVFKKA